MDGVERDALLALVLTPGFGQTRIGRCIDAFGSAHATVQASVTQLAQIERIGSRTAGELRRKLDDTLNNGAVARDAERRQQWGARLVALGDEAYPRLLTEIHDPPYILYFKGDPALMDRKILGIVGSRKASRYTYESLKAIIPDLKDLSVVSGLAYGADEAAHRLCLSYGVPTIGVLAFGHDTHYPKSTYDIRGEMEKHHLTISEYPPAAPVAKWRFIARNRIIAGLAEGVLVTEAEEKSGSLITLEMALNENRNAYCLPGNITSQLSKGTNLRIREGAEIILSAEDILKDFI